MRGEGGGGDGGEEKKITRETTTLRWDVCINIHGGAKKGRDWGELSGARSRYAPPPPPPPPSEPKPTRVYIYPSVALVTHTQPFSRHGVLLPPPPSVQPTPCSGNLEAEQVRGKESPIASLTSTPSREGRERGGGMRRKCSSRTALKTIAFAVRSLLLLLLQTAFYIF